MGDLNVTVFDVEHGLCAFIKSPTGRTLLIDCGRKAKFSPIKYIVDYERADAFNEGAFYFTEFVLSHPHGDHLEDIDMLIKYPPRLITRQDAYDWAEVRKVNSEKGRAAVDTYRSAWSNIGTYSGPVIDWGFNYDHGNYLTPAEAKQLQETKMVNNSSIPVIITYTGSKYRDKFLFAGDFEEKAWKELLRRQAFKDAIKGTNFFITSHHGHTTGYCKEIFEAMGNPIVNIVSAHSGDESVEGAYSDSKNATGHTSNGVPRYMLTTRKDKSIRISVNSIGQYRLWCEDYADNVK